MNTELVKRLRAVKRGDSYCQSIMDAYGTLEKGQFWEDIIQAADALTTSEARCAELVEALEAVDSEVMLTGNLKDIVDTALARSILLKEDQ